ncbi:MAG: hypothetical protein MHMPM18_005106 [Marteilia pararefringens]
MVFERRLLKCKSRCIDRLVGELNGSFEMQNSEELHVLLFHLLYLAHFRRDMVMRRILSHYDTILEIHVEVDQDLLGASSEDAERANHSKVAESLLSILQELIKYNTIVIDQGSNLIIGIFEFARASSSRVEIFRIGAAFNKND